VKFLRVQKIITITKIKERTLNSEVNMNLPKQSRTSGDNNVFNDYKQKRILVADDDNEMRALLVKALRDGGYGTLECCDGLELLEHFGTFSSTDAGSVCDIIVSDIRMPGFSGLEILDFIHDNAGFPPVVLITAFGDETTHQRAKQLGAIKVLDKPFEMDTLLQTVMKTLETRSRYNDLSRRGSKQGPYAAPLPFDVVFRNMLPCADISEHISKSLTNLKKFLNEVIFIRTIVDIPNGSNGGTDYFIRIILTVHGKVFVVSSNHLKESARQNAFFQITNLIAILYGQMERYFGNKDVGSELVE
jgi:CheY-like chemotaxis protein